MTTRIPLRLLASVLAAGLLSGACTLPPVPAGTTSEGGSVLPGHPPAAGSVQADPAGPLSTPDRTKTPGAVATTRLSDVCPHVASWLEAGRPSSHAKQQVYRRYGILRHTAGQYEIDHLIPLELGGANSTANLWPQLNDHPRAGVLNSKDLLENRMHQLVCSGRLQLTVAQREIASDWKTAYRRYVAGR